MNMASPLELENRLQRLETKEKTNAREILRLKKENVELQTAVYDLKEENSQTETKFREMETQISQHKNNLREAFGFKDSIISRLNHIESKMMHLNDNHDRVSKLETTMNESREEISNHCQLVKDKLDAFEKQLHTQDLVHDACDKEQTLVKTMAVGMTKGHISTRQRTSLENIEKQSKHYAYDDEGTKLKTVADVGEAKGYKSSKQGMSVTHRLECIEKQTQDIQDSILVLDLENIRALGSRSITQVHLKPSQSLVTGRMLKLDQWEWVSTEETFDLTSCCLRTQADGEYFVNVSFVQENNGELLLWAKSDDWSSEFYFGKTVSDNDVSSSTHVFSLRKGQKLWLEACRTGGNAEIAACYLYCWLLKIRQDKI